MRRLVLAGVLALAGAGGSLAEEAAAPGAAKPHVAVCGRDGMAERALKREHGAAEWTTAAAVLAAVNEGRGWAAPRCMSKLEYWRLTQGLDRMRRAELARARAERVLARR